MNPTLAQSSSPFLRHGAEQPVRWLPWGDAAFRQAREQDRPILLDIGAVWCHWCHVMDRESYGDSGTAALINEHFVPVKVDRDERPDVDARYQRAVQMMTGQGGWPLTAFLTPDGQAFYGGTYFPPDDRYGRPSFRRVLTELSRVWREDRERAGEAARGLNERLSALAAAETEAGELDHALVDRTIESLARAFDARYGGFGGAPKFPSAPALHLLLDRWAERRGEREERAVRGTLDGMARGGIRDQLGGGFHRYSVDARWNVPHFEKMAYDNALLLEAYARAASAWREPAYRDVCEDVVDYYRDVGGDVLERGGFPASQDADVGPDDDGAYWTWSLDEMRDALGDEALLRLARLRFGLDTPDGAMPEEPDRHVLYLARTADELAAELELPPAQVESMLAEARRALKAARDRRPRPFVDTTAYTGWSALLASGFLAAERWAGVTGAADIALRALDRVARLELEPDGLPHRMEEADGARHLDDQAHAAAAFLDAFEWTQDARWLTHAERVLEVALERYRDDSGGFRDRPRDAGGAGLLEQPFRPIADAPEPAANPVLAIALLRAAALTGNDAYEPAADGVLRAFAGAATRLGTMANTYVRAVHWLMAGSGHLVVVAEQDEPLWAAALGCYRPRTVLRRLEPGAPAPDHLPEELHSMLSGDAPRAYLCAGSRCAAPVSNPTALRRLLIDFDG